MACEGSRCESHEKKQLAVVFQNGKGTLSYTCHYCGRAYYAIKGSAQYQDWMQDIKLDKPLDPTNIARAEPDAPEPALIPSPQPKKKLLFL